MKQIKNEETKIQKDECLNDEDVYTKQWDIEGEEVTISIKLVQ